MDHYDDRRLSETLMEAMKVKGMNVPKLSEATGVPDRIIELLLAEHFEELPPAPYVRGYLIKIAEILGIDGAVLWDAYGKYHREIRRAGPQDALPVNRFELPRISRKFILGGVLALLIVSFVTSRFLFGGRAFTLEVNIPENLVVTAPAYVLQGHVRPGDQLTVNEVPFTLQGDGTFVREWDLKPEFNTLRFMVTRPLEGSQEFVKQIFYEALPTSTERP